MKVHPDPHPATSVSANVKTRINCMQSMLKNPLIQRKLPFPRRYDQVVLPIPFHGICHVQERRMTQFYLIPLNPVLKQSHAL